MITPSSTYSDLAAVEPNIASTCSLVNESRGAVRLSKRRWAVLFAMSVFGMTSFLTSEVSPILHTMLDLLEVTLSQYVYILQFFNYLPALMTVPTAWFIDRYGIQVSMYIVTGLMLIRNGSKALLFNPDLSYWKSLKMTYYIITNVTGTQIMITYFCMPLKVSENWFATSERSVAWTVMMSASNIGVSVAAFLLPRFIHSVSDVKFLFYLNIGAAILTTVTIICCITRSMPKHPPSERMIKSQAEPLAYFSSLKKTIKHRDIMVHLLHEAVFEGLYLSAMTIIQDILMSSGHTQIFVGNLISVLAIFSVITLVVLASFVHRVTNATSTCKIASIARSSLFVLHLFTMLYPMSGWVILAVALLCSLLKSWAAPNFNNMTAQLACGMVSEATIAGIAVTITVVTISMGQLMFVQLSRTVNGQSDYTYSIICASVLAMVDSFLYLIFFKGKNENESVSNEIAPNNL